MSKLSAGREAGSGAGGFVYECHRPERTLLYPLVQEYYPALQAQLAAQGTELSAGAIAIDGGWAPIQWMTNIPQFPLATPLVGRGGCFKMFRFVSEIPFPNQSGTISVEPSSGGNLPLFLNA